MSDVFWVDLAQMAFDNSVAQKLSRVLRESGAASALSEGMRVALKINTAEDGYEYGLRPALVRTVAAAVEKATGTKPTVCDGLKLVDYWNGSKGQAFLNAARSRGYSNDTLGGTFVINGGFSGDEGNLYSIGLPDSALGGVEVGAAVCRSDAVWVLAHVTLHPLFGLAGALWNGGFECLVGRERTRVLQGVDAYAFNGHRPSAASLRGLRQRALESHLGVRASVEGRLMYVNTLWDVTPRPEYFPFSESPLVENLGFLVSRDPVALDAATAAMLEAALPALEAASPAAQTASPAGCREELEAFRDVLQAAESLGLGCAQPTVRRLS